MDSVAYPRLKKFAYEGIANFFILRICLDFIATLILEIRWVGVCGLFLGLLLWITLLRLRLLSLGGLLGSEGHL